MLTAHHDFLAPALAPPALAFDAKASAQMECMLRDLATMYHAHQASLRALERAHHETLMRLAQAAELRDDDTGVHIVRMGYLAEALSRHAGLSADAARALRLAAPMHDVGKIGVADRALKKPGPLDDEERCLMQQHPRMGAEILGRSQHPLFVLAAEVALTHHERWDGTGYPQRLKGTEIPLAGRVVAIVDGFDALTMDRCYRPAFSDEVAMSMLLQQAGRAYDPELLALFVDRIDEMRDVRQWVNQARPGLGNMADVDVPLRTTKAPAHHTA